LANNTGAVDVIASYAVLPIDNAVQVLERERQLKQQIEQLRIEINEAKRAQQVPEVTETEYFQRLQEKAREIRGAADEPLSESESGG